MVTLGIIFVLAQGFLVCLQLAGADFEGPMHLFQLADCHYWAAPLKRPSYCKIELLVHRVSLYRFEHLIRPCGESHIDGNLG